MEDDKNFFHVGKGYGEGSGDSSEPLLNIDTDSAVSSFAAGIAEKVESRAVNAEAPQTVSPDERSLGGGSHPRLPGVADSPSASPLLLNPGASLNGGLAVGMSQSEQAKKVGSPKYGPDRNLLSPESPVSGSPSQKRGRDRSLVTGIKQSHLSPKSPGSGSPSQKRGRESESRALKAAESPQAVSPDERSLGGGSHPRPPGGADSPSVSPQLLNPGANLDVPSSGNGSGEFQVGESPPAFSYLGGNLGGGFAVRSQSDLAKKKVGRLDNSPKSTGSGSPSQRRERSPTPGLLSLKAPGSGSPSQKRRRGRPPGKGFRQRLATLGEWADSSAVFTPHMITIERGEDILAKIVSLSQQMPWGFCILSAHGAVSTVTFCQSDASGDKITYEGRFEILCLSGSYKVDDNGGRSGGLTICIPSQDGRVIGGHVSGQLMAATRVQVFLFFVRPKSKKKNKGKASNE